MAASTPKSAQHEAALYWAARGFPVFPVSPGGKTPIVKDWPNAATVDAAAIDGWWNEQPDANIGCPPDRSGCFVVDVDDKGDKCGSVVLAALEAERGALPETLTIETASGGRHMWFKGSAANSVGKLGAGLDVRGISGFVLMPGSVVGGRSYKTARDVKPASPAPWLLAELSAPRERKKTAGAVDEDLPHNLERAAAMLARLVATGDVAVEGSGGSDRTYRLAAALGDMGISEDAAVELLGDWNAACVPPWDADELARIVHNAYSYRQNDTGVATPDAGGSVFASVALPPHGGGQSAKRSRFRFLDEAAQDALPEPSWLIPGWLQNNSTAVLYGEPGSYKSFVALDMALSVAAGLPALGLDYEARALPVVYVAPEGAIGIAKQRRAAWRAARGVEGPLPFWLAPEAPLIREPASIADFMAELEKRCSLPRLIVLDTYSRIMAGLDENAAQDASRAVETASGLAQRYSCTVLMIHHAAKDGDRERGSTALRAGVDTFAKCEADKGARLLRLSCSKQKDAEEPRTLCFKTVPVGGSIVLARAEPGTFTDADAQMKMDAIACLRDAGAYGMAEGLPTKALAMAIAARMGEEETAHVGIMRRLNALSKAEWRALYYTEAKPPVWALPIADRPA